MEAPEAVKAEIKALNDGIQSNLKAVREEVEALKASHDAIIGEKIKRINEDTAAKVDEVTKALNKRIDEESVALQERFSRSGGSQASDPFAGFAKGFADSGMNPETRGRSFTYTAPIKALTDLDASGGPLLVPQQVAGIIRPGETAFGLYDIVPKLTTSASSIEFTRELAQTGGADYQGAQGTKKAETNFTFDSDDEKVETIAHFTKAAKQILADRVGLQGYIESRMMYLLRHKVSAEIANGNGASGHLHGIIPQAVAYDNADESEIEGGANNADRVLLALDQVDQSEYPATHVALNTTRWALVRAMKDETGRYALGGPQGSDPNRLWGFPVVTDRALTRDQFLAGSFTPAALQLWMREEAAITVATMNEDDFVKNLITILAEMRAALTVYRPSSFVLGSFVPVGA